MKIIHYFKYLPPISFYQLKKTKTTNNECQLWFHIFDNSQSIWRRTFNHRTKMYTFTQFENYLKNLCYRQCYFTTVIAQFYSVYLRVFCLVFSSFYPYNFHRVVIWWTIVREKEFSMLWSSSQESGPYESDLLSSHRCPIVLSLRWG